MTLLTSEYEPTYIKYLSEEELPGTNLHPERQAKNS